MNTSILGLLAETAIHPGAGTDTGFVDLPVAREAATDYPVIVGSSFKGALLDLARNGNFAIECDRVFGQQENAGALIVSDVRLLLLPVRSMTGHYKWVTCPHLIERYRRDRQRANFGEAPAIDTGGLGEGQYLGIEESQEMLFLEERQFTRAGKLPEKLTSLLQPLIRHELTGARLPEQVVILYDNDFIWFARFGLVVNARNVLDDAKKTSKNLWYEETIPPDSLFYCLLAERGDHDAVSQALGVFKNRPYIQVGGNATIGQGWFVINTINRES